LLVEYERVIPKFQFKVDKSNGEYNLTECIICMDTFKDNELLSKLSTCKHYFHPKCIMEWFGGTFSREI
jgi:hypothetical protein